MRHLIDLDDVLIKGQPAYTKHYDDYTGEYVIKFDGAFIGRTGNDGTAVEIAREHAGAY